MRVLLDTNVVIAAFATRGLCQDVMPASAAAKVIDFLRAHAEVVRPDAPAPVPKRDQDDRWVVAAALHGNADVLVSGDDDLRSMTSNLPVAIVSPRGFWEMLRGRGAR